MALQSIQYLIKRPLLTVMIQRLKVNLFVYVFFQINSKYLKANC
jgi:hypothetical protein